MIRNGIDVGYRPHSDGWQWLSEYQPNTILVVGSSTDELAERLGKLGAQEIRNTSARMALRHLHDGAYVADFGGCWTAILVFGANGEVESSFGRRRTDASHLGSAADAYEDYWGAATPLLGNAPFMPGQLVRSRSGGPSGRVRRVTREMTGHHIDVEIDSSIRGFDSEDLVAVDGDPSDPTFWLAQEPADAESTALTLSWLKLYYPLTDMLYSYAATKTTFKPYQFIPALKILTSATGRLLIADEVGLGKTIEAGLIWTELEQRKPISRALVVVPASLQIKWRQEMDRRFMRPLKILKATDMREFAQQVREGQEPELLGIVSVEALRGAHELLADLAELSPHFDLVIVDEAHVLRNRTSKSYQLGNLLSDWADYLVFLSATPLNLGSEDLFNLVNLLDEGGFPDPEVFEGQLAPNRALNRIARNVANPIERSRIIARTALLEIPMMEHGAAIAGRVDFERLRETLKGNAPISHSEVAAIKRMVAELNTLGGVLSRTRKVDIPDKKAVRVARQIVVQWSPQERAFYDAFYEYFRAKALSSSVPTGFAMQMPLRQASSCIVVAQQKLLEKEGWTTDADDIGYEFWDSDEYGQQEPSWDGALEVLTSPINHDSKFDALVAHLRVARRNGMRKVLIFSFFRGTVDYLARRLASEFSSAALHGGVPMESRGTLIERFRDGDFDILVANQVGSEGLDFEFCNVLVNYDLPWNPMQVEQRIGRLDRFGQKFEKIFIFNMHVPDTIESEIIERLYTRIGVFERSIGDLEPIMQDTMREIRDRVLDPKLTPLQMQVEIDRVAVATERKQEDLRQLEASGGVLNTLSQLDIDGLTDNGPTSGRYIGHSELQRLIRNLLQRYGGSLTPGPRGGTFLARGNQELAVALRQIPRSDRGTTLGYGRLVGRLRDGVQIVVAFGPESLQGENIELITSRHPLISLAIHELKQDPLRLWRFGSVRLPGLTADTRYLIRLDIARSSGVQELCELWITAIDQITGERNESVEERLMVDLAEDRFETSLVASGVDLADGVAALRSLVAKRQQTVRLERAQDNSAMVDARIASEMNSIEIKLERARTQLSQYGLERKDSNRSRMLSGRVRNLTHDLDGVKSRLESKRHLTLSIEFAAIIVVTG